MTSEGGLGRIIDTYSVGLCIHCRPYVGALRGRMLLYIEYQLGDVEHAYILPMPGELVVTAQKIR